ncbi:thiamine phosphate synthase [Clostridium luticellarii]|jgi:thiamine-phosphate pyrophosphorylase|uniref:Thiamine-phosphate synthase n=1 Tax=Clostridium luticellarii TaxID=1691940 RepID=A0A2T0BE00_9CLOT|nr:thiamine phosphate synthase [Clostridium luticellarii]MCI1945278.1 thiamine phosphate synthase [Clostridium luticellarii]MCI1969018.1 thiamine phosphate synthase [Clostridium luticellarii]MCI1994611.1 thiamine phosphate synthase [Clostridium luticellarii]MCI2038892.1 thiamine phosphate synthase [Clostridium luticellarii]PRR82047.1 Thiamine-phosphate synthase [Clostridium luticellarii]
MEIDYSLYLVTDRGFLKNISLSKAVEDAILGGVTLVQLREKNISTREFYKLALEIKEVTHHYNIPFIINDRLDIAQAVDADGVHLGQSDMPLTAARRILGKNKIIGISAGTVEEAVDAEKNSADYVGIGTVFFTGTKKDIDTPIGVGGVRRIYNSINIPAVAIGGISQDNFKDVLSTGVDGISVISAILGKEDIKSAARNLKMS